MKRNRIIDIGMANVLDDWYSRVWENYRAIGSIITICDILIITSVSIESVYLRTDPDVAFARVRTRARNEEGAVTAQYLREIHDLHEEWIADVQELNDQHDEPIMPVRVNGCM